MSKIFIDDCNLNNIEELLQWGCFEGVTTNQGIFNKEQQERKKLGQPPCNFEDHAKKILKLSNHLPVSLEGPNDINGLLEKAKIYASWGTNAVIKIPMLSNGDGLKVVTLLEDTICTNVTACMSINQAYLAINAGASYVSLFYNRMKDWNHTDADEKYALETIKTVQRLCNESGYTELIIGSIRSPDDIEKILTVCTDIVTIPTKILRQMPHNDMTNKTLKEFDDAWIEFCKGEKK